MNPERLKKAISIATDAVSHMGDKDLKLKTYEIILKSLMTESELSSKISSITSPEIKDYDSYKLLQSKLKLNDGINIRDYIDLDEQPRLLFKLNRDNSVEEQLIFLLSFLSIKKVCYGVPEISSSTLRDMLAEHKIPAINNLSTNVKKFNRFIIHKSGKIGNTNTSYKITEEGISNGLRILSEILNGSNVHQLNLDFLGLKLIKKNKYTSKVGEEIDKLLDEGFFNQYRKTNETVLELRNRGFFNRRQDIDAYLRKVLLGKFLIRGKIENSWSYVVKK